MTHVTHPASPHGDFCVSEHPHSGKITGWILRHKPWPPLSFPLRSLLAPGGAGACFTEWLWFQSPGAIEVEMHCPERFNKTVFQPQRWAPSHSPLSLPSNIPWLTGNQSPEEPEHREENNSPESKQLQHGNHLYFWAVAVTETNAHLYLPQHLQYLILQNSPR